jgi:L-asparaginase
MGVVVALAGTIEAADDVTKMHTTAFDTFRSPNRGSLGTVGQGSEVQAAVRGPRRRLRPVPSDGARVELIEAGIGTDGAMIDAAVAAGARGVVVAATGAGNTSPAMLEAAERAMAENVAVVLASRCPSGAVTTAYAFPGGGGTWVRAGAIPGGTLCAIKARVALSLGLGASLSRDGLATLLADPLG